MLKVSYDCDIEQNMMEWLQQCKYAHSPYSVRNGWGQNLFMVNAPKVNKTKVAPWSVKLWYDELANNGVPQENVMTKKVFGRGIGHYSQVIEVSRTLVQKNLQKHESIKVVWQSSNKIGCGIMWCEKMTYAGCEYSPAGNFIGASIYEVGEPCSKCDCEGCKCNKEDGLCIAPANPTKNKKAHEKHQEKDNKEKHREEHKEVNTKKAQDKHHKEQKEVPTTTPVTHCPFNNGMTDEVRQMFVDKHNEIRSVIARGLAKNKLGGFAPKAAKMLKVSYDCEVEQNMMEWAKQCKWAHSSYKARNGWGQNLYSVNARNLNKTRMAKQSVEAWFSELTNRGVPQDNIISWNVFAKGVGHYSQVAWHNSNKIGCAVQWCEKMTFVGCEYKPTGNYLGAPIYEVGEPCSKCTCEGCKCNKEDGLCVTP
ncbi:SCP-like protein [Teladorsagia circumcincta]|uniref:SCP-like protein n=1 Tax=Teladorsagia circumcincta TaxID=45464 RepID=A0A2G9TTA1_TELCI|nr:SCP-like protein [Teladorsagia circumcincta]